MLDADDAMDELNQTIQKYFRGELSDSQQQALEEEYFTDPKVFDQVLSVESDLVDSYARGRMSGRTREQFESAYLADPRRHERVKFAEALASRIDQGSFSALINEESGRRSPWQRLVALFRGHRLLLGFSVAVAAVLLIAAAWIFVERGRSRQEIAGNTNLSQPLDQEQITREQERKRETDQQAAERKQAEALRAEQERAQQNIPQETPTPKNRVISQPTFATLSLTIGGRRGANTTSRSLVISPGTTEARIELNLVENDYSRYGVSLHEAGGREIFKQENLKSRITKSGSRFTITIPAQKFTTGDYVLTVRGVNQSGESEDISKSIFHVQKG
jgi:hypothetical protein